MMYDPAMVAALRGQGGVTQPGTQMPGRNSQAGAGMVQQQTMDTSGFDNALGMLAGKGVKKYKARNASPGAGVGPSGMEGLISPQAPSSSNPAGGFEALMGKYSGGLLPAAMGGGGKDGLMGLLPMLLRK